MDELLTHLNINKTEAKILLTALNFGSQPASVLAAKSGISRSSVFFPLKNLIKQGLMEKELRANVSYFNPVSVLTLKKKFQENLKTAEKNCKIFEELLIQSNFFQSPKNLLSSRIRHFEGINGIRRQIDDIVKADSDIYFISAHNIHPQIKSYLRQKYIPARLKSLTRAYMIANDSPALREYLEASEGVYEEVYPVPKEKYPLELSMAIYDNSLSLISCSEEDLTGVIIENQFFANHMRTIFQMLKAFFAPYKICFKKRSEKDFS